MEETTKLAKLESIAAKLIRGKNVQNRQLQTWLSEDECAQIGAQWKEQLTLREKLKDKPSELKRFEDKLKEAIMMRTIARVKSLWHISWTEIAKVYVKMH